jgi:LysR family glycine cleavage system transcriptional activator
MQFRELPPLAFLPAVEAAGRLGSFKAAAAELHITASAVSQQVKAVEESLGIELFARQGRSVELTHEGERYLRAVRQALLELSEAGKRMQRKANGDVLRLDTLPFVAHEFVLPRIASLHARFPSFRVELETSVGLVDLTKTEIDATIRLGSGPWPGLFNWPIGAMIVTMVCSPALARTIHSPQDLAQHTLIEIRSLQDRGIVNLVKGLGIAVDPARVQTFDSYFETVRAAEHGLGVAYGMFPLTTSWVTSGRLAVPFAYRGTLAGSVSLVHRPNDERFPFPEFAAWLKEEYAALPALGEGRIGAD